MKPFARSARAALAFAAVLAIPTVASAAKLIITVLGHEYEVSCDSTKYKCDLICSDLDDLPLVSCTYENGIMRIIDNRVWETLQVDNEANVALAADSPITVTTDEPTGTVHGFADHAVAVQVIKADGNPVLDLGEVQDFTATIYDGEQLQITSYGAPTQLELWLDAPTAPATLVGPSAPDAPTLVTE